MVGVGDVCSSGEDPLSADPDLWLHPVWIADSTPVECARSRRPTLPLGRLGQVGATAALTPASAGTETSSDLHPAGLPVTWAPTDPKVDERQVLMAICQHDPNLLATRTGLIILADRGYIAAELDRFLAARDTSLLRPSYRNCGAPRPGESLLKTAGRPIACDH